MIISRKFGEQIWTFDKVMEHFNSERRAQESCIASPILQVDYLPNITAEHKVVLGVGWDTTLNEFLFRLDDLVSKCATIKQTKRNLLIIAASIFDPLGFIAPVTAKIKTIFQLLCKDKLDWDEIIPDKIAFV